MYVAIANYFRTFTNFRAINCELDINMYLNPNIITPGSLCSVNPPLNSTDATITGSFYGIDLTVSNDAYCFD